MWKKYSYIPKILELKLNFEKRTQVYEFQEPSLYDLEVFQGMINEEEYLKALKYLGINIKEGELFANPTGVIQAVYRLCYGEATEKSENPVFMPSIYDMLAKRYGKTPIEILKEFTPSTIESCLAGFEYNMNIEADKKSENYKFKDKTQKRVSDEELKEAERIMKRIEEYKKKNGV